MLSKSSKSPPNSSSVMLKSISLSSLPSSTSVLMSSSSSSSRERESGRMSGDLGVDRLEGLAVEFLLGVVAVFVALFLPTFFGCLVSEKKISVRLETRKRKQRQQHLQQQEQQQQHLQEQQQHLQEQQQQLQQQQNENEKGGKTREDTKAQRTKPAAEKESRLTILMSSTALDSFCANFRMLLNLELLALKGRSEINC